MKRLKRILCLVLVLCVAMGCTSAMAWDLTKALNLVTGEFTGTAEGFGGEVSVTLVIKDRILTDVIIVGEEEFPDFGGKAMEQMAQAMMEKEDITVDIVTGATITSMAVLEAAQMAKDEIGAESFRTKARELADFVSTLQSSDKPQ